ncbi:MAG: hypothetical protein QF394_12640, partial [Rhodospirillales bacterium]|nr:hypothetical protein [Rhodospirillales bacterium]
MGEVRLDNGNYRKIAFRTALNCQSWRCSVVGEDSPLRNSVILYTRTEFGDYLGNVGLGEQILRLMQPLHNKKIFISRKLQVTL